MPTSLGASAIRPGSTRAEIYNEGQVIYLYDDANRDAIRAAKGVELVERALDGEGGEKQKSVLAFGKTAMLVAYELRQDDSVVVDVSVGPVLAKEELGRVKAVKWLAVQLARLALPSGRLCVESSNSSRIDPDEDPQEKGAVIQVPPGDYVLGLHRLNVEAMSEAQLKAATDAALPGEFVTLCPIGQAAKAPKPGIFALPFPLKKAKKTWAGDYTIEGANFTGLINFLDYSDTFLLNIDRAALDKLGLQFGSVFDVDANGRRLTGVWLGEGLQFALPQFGADKRLVSSERTLSPVANEPELSLAAFRKQLDPPIDALACVRIRTSEIIPEELHEKWKKVVVRVRPQTLEPIDRPLLGRWTAKGDAIHGQSLYSAPRFVTVNLDRRALASLGASAGDTLILTVGPVDYPVKLYASQASLADAIQRATPDRFDESHEYNKLRSLWAEADKASRPAIVERMRKSIMPDPYLAICPDRHWYVIDGEVLLIQPAVADRGLYALNFLLPFSAPAGTGISLRTTTDVPKPR